MFVVNYSKPEVENIIIEILNNNFLSYNYLAVLKSRSCHQKAMKHASYPTPGMETGATGLPPLQNFKKFSVLQ